MCELGFSSMEYVPVILSLFVAHLFILISPGPNVLLISTISASHSRKAGLHVSLGVATAAFIWPSLAIVGLGFIFQSFSWLYLTIKFLGAIYLVYLGVKSWQSAKKPVIDTSVSTLEGRQSSFYLKGLITSLSNPKVLVFFTSFFAALLPPIVPIWVKVVVVIMFGINSLVWHGFVAYVMSMNRIQTIYGAVKIWLDRIVGVFFIVLGLRLAFFGKTS